MESKQVDEGGEEVLPSKVGVIPLWMLMALMRAWMLCTIRSKAGKFFNFQDLSSEIILSL
jgi:hypothetical protein